MTHYTTLICLKVMNVKQLQLKQKLFDEVKKSNRQSNRQKFLKYTLKYKLKYGGRTVS